MFPSLFHILGIVVLPDVCPAITRGVPIRPKMLDENVRANLFPEQVKGVVVR